MIFWAADNGGYDAGTWYWGALLLLGGLTAVALLTGTRGWRRISRPARVALLALSLYVAWSYLSITWAQSPGDALQGSNRALMYLLLFALLALLPWTVEAALAALLVFAVGIGVIALVMLLRLGSTDNLQSLIVDHRLLAPTGYFNATVALFMTGALVSTALAAGRRLPGLLRGALVALAAAELQLAVIGQSRGWLFTLPIVVLVCAVVVRDRIRVAAAALLPVLATLVSLHRLLAIYRAGSTAALDHAAREAGRISLLLCAAVLVVATLAAWADGLRPLPSLPRGARRSVGAGVAVLAIAAGVVGVAAATHGDPVGFLKRQWHGFTHPPASAAYLSRSHSSYFGTVGTGRYDFWRVSLQALRSHPLGGLGQDNFADYYVKRRRTIEEPQWTHSLEMRLLAHTGIVGFLLFAAFACAAVIAAARARLRAGPLTAWVAGAALLPFVEWLIHGSIDWFWELPALSAPALGFLAMAGALGPAEVREDTTRRAWPSFARPAAVALGLAAMLACAVALGLPYLSTRETSAALSIRDRNSSQALKDLQTAAALNPLTAVPARFAGAIALQTGRFNEAEGRFGQAIAREPGGWFSWFGRGLAASALGDAAAAEHDFRVAASINSRQPAVVQALARVNTRHPLTPSQAFGMLVLSQ